MKTSDISMLGNYLIFNRRGSFFHSIHCPVTPASNIVLGHAPQHSTLPATIDILLNIDQWSDVGYRPGMPKFLMLCAFELIYLYRLTLYYYCAAWRLFVAAPEPMLDLAIISRLLSLEKPRCSGFGFLQLRGFLQQPHLSPVTSQPEVVRCLS